MSSPVEAPLPLGKTVADLRAAAFIAGRAAIASRTILVEGFRQAIAPRSQEGRDIKLEADHASEKLIVAALREHSPYPILSEESGWVGEPDPDGYHWVVDPLDGSFNYHRGVPLCATAVAFCYGRQPLVGAICDFLRDETFCGGPHIGLEINGRKVELKKPQPQIIATGFPVRGDFSAKGMQSFATLIADWKKVRMIGSAALSLAWVAVDRFDGYSENGIMWWDVAAGLALAGAAGLAARAEGPSIMEPLNVYVARGSQS